MSGEITILLQELCLIINVFLCFGIPIIGIILLNKKYEKIKKSFFIGMVAFFISQIVIRIPILQYVLPNLGWYIKLQYQPYLYGLFLGFSASIFEGSARLIFLKFFLKDRTRIADGFSFGLGHGGIEAMLLVGVNNAIVMIAFPMGFVELTQGSTLSILLAGLERVIAITFHICASLIVLYGIREHKAIRFTLLAIVLHGLMDSSIVIIPIAFSINTIGLEIYLVLFTLLTVCITLFLYHRSKKGNIIVQKIIS